VNQFVHVRAFRTPHSGRRRAMSPPHIGVARPVRSRSYSGAGPKAGTAFCAPRLDQYLRVARQAPPARSGAASPSPGGWSGSLPAWRTGSVAATWCGPRANADQWATGLRGSHRSRTATGRSALVVWRHAPRRTVDGIDMTADRPAEGGDPRVLRPHSTLQKSIHHPASGNHSQSSKAISIIQGEMFSPPNSTRPLRRAEPVPGQPRLSGRNQRAGVQPACSVSATSGSFGARACGLVGLKQTPDAVASVILRRRR
jgi:hypothetical protein